MKVSVDSPKLNDNTNDDTSFNESSEYGSSVANHDKSEPESCEQSADFLKEIHMQLKTDVQETSKVCADSSKLNKNTIDNTNINKSRQNGSSVANLDNTELESCEQSADFVEEINMQLKTDVQETLKVCADSPKLNENANDNTSINHSRQNGSFMTNLDNTELESCEKSADFVEDFVEAVNMQTDEQLLDSAGTYLSIADQQGYTVPEIDENFEFSVAGDSITTISNIESHKTQGHYDILKTLNISILNPTDTTIHRNQFSQFQHDSHSKALAVYQNEIQNCSIPISRNLQPKVVVSRFSNK